MKITQNDYNHMKSQIETFVAANQVKIAGHKIALQNDTRVKDLGKRFRWDLFNASGLLDFTCQTLYKYCNDSHIDSALKKIVQEIGVS